jgi:hypothetical protein
VLAHRKRFLPGSNGTADWDTPAVNALAWLDSGESHGDEALELLPCSCGLAKSRPSGGGGLRHRTKQTLRQVLSTAHPKASGAWTDSRPPESLPRSALFSAEWRRSVRVADAMPTYTRTEYSYAGCVDPVDTVRFDPMTFGGGDRSDFCGARLDFTFGARSMCGASLRILLLERLKSA